MKKAVAAALCLVVVFLAGCAGQQSTPEGTIQKLEQSVQKLDINSMLDCFEPSASKGVRATLKIAGSLLGVSAEDIIDLLPFAMDIGRASGGEDFADAERELKQFSLQVVKVNYNQNRTRATVTVKYDGGTDSVDMVMEQGKWYLCMY